MSRILQPCLICLLEFESTDATEQDPAEPSVKYSPSEYSENLQTFENYSSLLAIPPEITRQWNFKVEPLPFCIACSRKVERIVTLKDQLDSIQKSIDKMMFATKCTMMLVTSKTTNSGTSRPSKSRKFDLFRRFAVKDLAPIVMLRTGNFATQNFSLELNKARQATANNGPRNTQTDVDVGRQSSKFCAEVDKKVQPVILVQDSSCDDDCDEQVEGQDESIGGISERPSRTSLIDDIWEEKSQRDSERGKIKRGARGKYGQNVLIPYDLTQTVRTVTGDDGRVMVGPVELKYSSSDDKWLCTACDNTFFSKYLGHSHVKYQHLGFTRGRGNVTVGSKRVFKNTRVDRIEGRASFSQQILAKSSTMKKANSKSKPILENNDSPTSRQESDTTNATLKSETELGESTRNKIQLITKIEIEDQAEEVLDFDDYVNTPESHDEDVPDDQLEQNHFGSNEKPIKRPKNTSENTAKLSSRRTSGRKRRPQSELRKLDRTTPRPLERSIQQSDGRNLVKDIEIKYNHAAGRWACTECQDTFLCKHNVVGHVNNIHLGLTRQAHRTYRLAFPQPETFIKDKSGNLTHLGYEAKLSQDNTYECTTCGIGLKTKYNFALHVKAVHLKMKRKMRKRMDVPNERQALRSRTVKAPDGRSYFERVEIIRLDGGGYQCGACGKNNYSSKAGLMGHIKHCHADLSKRMYKCECGKSFAYEHRFREHKRSHQSQKDFMCDICGISLKRRGNVFEHKRRVHENKTPYECDICFKKFFNKKDCRLHRNRHKSDKPCPIELVSVPVLNTVISNELSGNELD